MTRGNVVHVHLVVLAEVAGVDDVLQLHGGKGLWDAQTLQVATQLVDAMAVGGCCDWGWLGLRLELRVWNKLICE